MSTPEIDYRCYLVTSGTDRHTVDVAAAAAGAGAGIVQVRASGISDAEMVSLVVAVSRAVTSANPDTCIVVDDRCDIAAAARFGGARVDGVHLGQHDVDPVVARAILGPEAVVGLSAGTLEQIERANERAVDLTYIGAGPFRETPTKQNARNPIGLEGYPALVEASKLPIVAIGDVQLADIAALKATGVDGVCMVRAIMGASDPAAVVSGVLRVWDAA